MGTNGKKEKNEAKKKWQKASIERKLCILLNLPISSIHLVIIHCLEDELFKCNRKMARYEWKQISKSALEKHIKLTFLNESFEFGKNDFKCALVRTVYNCN